MTEVSFHRMVIGGSPQNPAEPIRRLELPPRPPYIWEPDVELPPGPTTAEVREVREALLKLERFQPETCPRRHHPRLVANNQEIIRTVHYRQPVSEGEDGRRRALLPVLYLIYNPLLLGPPRLRVRFQTSLSELHYLGRLDGIWHEYWRRAGLALQLWLDEEKSLQDLDRQLRQTWRGLPDVLTRDLTLAQLARIWIDFARQHCLSDYKLQEMYEQPFHVLQPDWDVIHSLGAWGYDFFRAWRAGFCDARWYYTLRDMDLHHDRIYHELLADYRQSKGRYLMFYEPRRPYERRTGQMGETFVP